MNGSFSSFAASALLALCINFLALHPAFGQDAQTGPIVIAAEHYDTSPPVRDMYPLSPRLGAHLVLPVHRRPGPSVIGIEPDPVTQFVEESAGPLVSTTNLLNFDGISDRDGVAPPDTNASVGATQVVETVNVSYQVFNKTTAASGFGPPEIAALFATLG